MRRHFLNTLAHLAPNSGAEWEHRLHFLITVRDVTRQEFAVLIARMDRLLAEAAAVREQMTAALRRRWQQPFWPDRRLTYQQYSPERRRYFQMEPTQG